MSNEIWHTAGEAHIRSSPTGTRDDDENILTRLPTRHPVTVVEKEGNWYSVVAAYQNRFWRGFVFRELLTNEGGFSHPRISNNGLPIRDAIFSDSETNALRPYLAIRPPGKDAKGSEAISIRRSREVTIDWNKLLSPKLLDGYIKATFPPFVTTDNFRYFYNHWSELWDLAAHDFKNGPPENFFAKNSVIYAEQIVEIQKDGRPKTTTRWSQPTDQFVLYHPTTDRQFALIPRRDSKIEEADFSTLQNISQMFSNKLDALRQCISASESTTTSPLELVTEVEIVDLGPAIIIRQFGELEAIKQFTIDLSAQADKLGLGAVTELLNEQQVNNLINAVLTMKTPAVERVLRLSELIDNSAALGYVIVEAEKTIKFDDGTEETLKPGNLYAPYQTTITWTTEHKRQSSSSNSGLFGLGSSNSSREWTEIIRHYKTVTKNRKIMVDLDPFNEREELLTAEGFNSFRLDRVGERYVTIDGLEVTEIIDRCEFDESFRRHCAIWLPIFEQKLSKGIMLTGYKIFKRPHKGIMPVRLPRFYFEELLSYRTSWEHTELGEVVYTMNLAPGEERNLTVEQKTSKTTEDIRSTVSVLDLTQTSSQDLNSEIEKEAKSSRDQSSSSSWSASASGSYGGFSGSASSSGENRTSTSQFARTFEKIAQKAASNLSRNTKQEVRANSTVKTDSSRTESTTIKIKNINDGRTLNLLFYRLNNVLNSGIYLDDLLVLNQPGVEVISGSGVVLAAISTPNRTSQSLTCFALRNLPFSPSRPEGTIEFTAIFLAYWNSIILKVCEIIIEEYAGKSAEVQENLKQLKVDIAPFQVDEVWTNEILEQHVAKLLKQLSEIIGRLTQLSANDEPIQAKSFIRVASPGLYVDSIMGSRPATEPYAEEMRAQTVRLRAAEADKEFALAGYYSSLGPKGREPALHALTRIDAKFEGKNITFDFKEGLPSGIWILQVDEQDVFSFELAHNESIKTVTATVEWSWQGDLSSHVYLLKHVESTVAVPIIFRKEF